jgi:DNA-binding LacI/PurR family transcriptional regulator
VTRILARIDGRRVDDREVVLQPDLTVRSSTTTSPV